MSTEVEEGLPINVKQIEIEEQKFSKMLSSSIKELLETYSSELDYFIGWELILVSLSSGQSLSDDDKKKAVEQEAPILIKKGTEFSVYDCMYDEWKETELKSRKLTHVEKTVLNNLDFNVSTIKSTNLPNELRALILKCHKELIFYYNTTSNFIKAYDQAYAEALSLITEQYALRWSFDPCREKPSGKTVYVNYPKEKIFIVNYNGCKEYIVHCSSNVNLSNLKYGYSVRDRYDLLLMSELPAAGPERRKIYIEKMDDKLNYTLISLNGKQVYGSLDISVDELAKEHLIQHRSTIIQGISKLSVIPEDLPSNDKMSKNTLYFLKHTKACKFIGKDGAICEEHLPDEPEFDGLSDNEFFYKAKDFFCKKGLFSDEDAILNSMPLKAQIIECIFYDRIRDAIQFDKLIKKFPKVLSVFIKHYRAAFQASEEEAISYFKVMRRKSLSYNNVGGNDAWKNIIEIINHCKYGGESVLDNYIRDINAPIKQIPYDPIGASQRMKKNSELSIKDIAALIYFDGAGQGYEDAVMLDVVERECGPNILPPPTEDEIERKKRWTSAVDFKNKFIAKIQTKGGLDYEPKNEIRNGAVEEKYRVIVPSGDGHRVKQDVLNNPVMFHIRFIGSEGKQETIIGEDGRPYFGRKYGQVWDSGATHKYLDENRLGWHEDNMVETTSAENILIHKDELSQYLKKPEGEWLLEIIKGTLVERWVKNETLILAEEPSKSLKCAPTVRTEWKERALKCTLEYLKKRFETCPDKKEPFEFTIYGNAELLRDVKNKLNGDGYSIKKKEANVSVTTKEKVILLELIEEDWGNFVKSELNNYQAPQKQTIHTKCENLPFPFDNEKLLKSIDFKNQLLLLHNIGARFSTYPKDNESIAREIGPTKLAEYIRNNPDEPVVINLPNDLVKAINAASLEAAKKGKASK